MKIRAFGTQIVIFGILLFISNSVSAQSSSHNTGEPIDKSHHRTTEDTRGNKILSGEMLRRTSIGNLWNAILSLEPSLTDGNSDLYGDVPYYIPQNTSLQGQTAWSLSGQPSSILFLIDGAQVSAYQFMCLNINDIEKIIIYKDAQSLTRLGTKGGNGAIEAILRTPQMGKLHINYLFDAQIQTADQSLQHPAADVKDIKGFDWKNTPIRTAFSHRHKLDIGGGDRYVKYNFSVEGDPSGKGVMKDDYHKTLGLSNYISYRRSIFSISNHLSFYQSKNNASPYGTYDYYRNLSPELSPYDANGKITTLLGNGAINPLHEVSTGSFNRKKIHTIQDRLKIEIALPADLHLDGNFSFIRETGQNDVYLSPSSGYYAGAEESSYTGQYDITRDNQLSFEGGLSLRYDKTWKKSVIGISSGINFLSNKWYDETFSGIGIPTDRMAYISFTQSYYSSETSPSASRYYDHNLSGIFSAHYLYDNRYGLSAGTRIEKSSLLASRARTAAFYSAGVFWNIHNESFMQNTGIEQLTLTFSHGTSGGIGFSNNAYTVTYDSNVGNEYIYNYYLVGTSIVLMPNDRLQWYTVMRNDLSLSARYRGVSLSILYYTRRTTDLPIITPLPLSTGYPHTFDNGGQVSNRGIEGTVSVDILPDSKNLSLLTFASLAYNRNRIDKLPTYFASVYNEAIEKSMETIGISLSTSFLQENRTLTELYHLDPTNGELVAKGSTAPTIRGNWGFSATYRQWQFNLVTTFSTGAKAYDMNRAKAKENPFVRDNRFSLRNVQLAYTFPAWKTFRLMLLASGENIFRYSSSDIDLGYYYPYARTYTLALRIQL